MQVYIKVWFLKLDLKLNPILEDKFFFVQ